MTTINAAWHSRHSRHSSKRRKEFETWLKDYWNADDERDGAGNTPDKCCEIGEAYCLGDHIVIKEIGVDNLDELSIYGGRNDDI